VISKGEEKIILDTKWKVIESISESGRNNISQSDLYQMFAYGKKYGAKTLFLIYPENEKFQIYPENEKFQKSCHLKYEKNDLDLYIFPWKFSSNEKESNIGNLINILKNPSLL
jgi:5-methylcytosine-specific restriction enzyme subunit McrC